MADLSVEEMRARIRALEAEAYPDSMTLPEQMPLGSATDPAEPVHTEYVRVKEQSSTPDGETGFRGLFVDSNGILKKVNQDGTTKTISGAGSDEAFVVTSSSSELSAERVLSGGANISLTDNGAGGSLDVAVVDGAGSGLDADTLQGTAPDGFIDVYQQDTAPSDTDALWVDTSVAPKTLKIYDPGNDAWRKVAAVSWGEVTNKPAVWRDVETFQYDGTEPFTIGFGFDFNSGDTGPKTKTRTFTFAFENGDPAELAPLKRLSANQYTSTSGGVTVNFTVDSVTFENPDGSAKGVGSDFWSSDWTGGANIAAVSITVTADASGGNGGEFGRWHLENIAGTGAMIPALNPWGL